MDLNFLFYCFLSVIIITGGAFYFFSSGLQTTAAIYFLGTTVASIFFGFRWFTTSGNSSSGPGAWPPAINYCPDFLTLTTIGGNKVCIDMAGVSQKSTLQKSDGTNTGDNYIFRLFTTAGTDRITQLCDEAKLKGVTWEGVWNGNSCSGTAPPLPP
jgi:hypothetical protein